MEILKELEMNLEEAKKKIQESDEENSLNEIKANYLGKKGVLSGLMQQMKTASSEERPILGQAFNKFKAQMEDAVNEQRARLQDKMINAKMEHDRIDVTMPSTKPSTGYLHPLTLIQEELEDLFIGMGYEVVEGPEVEEDVYNFELLNLPYDHPAREMQDTFYLDETMTRLLRTHTSPVQARTLLAKKGEPVRIICPGKVYRRDNDDATHSHQFMQMEGLVVSSDVSLANLKGTLLELARKMFGPEREIRLRPSYFPFTEPSVEVDVSCAKCNGKGCNICKGTGYIEVLGAGMVNKNVLDMCGYDSKKMRGFAFGVGIERFAMLKYKVDDIRHFYTDDVRFLSEFKGGK